MDSLLHDVRLALRRLTRTPGFTLVVVLTLALGIGANTAIFSVVDGILLRSLPLRAADELVMMFGASREGAKTEDSWYTSYPDYADIRAQNRVFSEMGAWTRATPSLLSPDAEPTRLRASAVTASLFPLVGVVPALGRVFLPDEEKPGAPKVALLGDALWRQRFGADPRIVGKSVLIDGEPHTVVGVMPAHFQFPGQSQLWLPATEAFSEMARGRHGFGVIARLQPGVTLPAAEREVRAIARRLEDQHPGTNADRTARLETAEDAIVGDVRPALLVLLGAVAVVLLIACANVANLMLARAAGRGREAAVRSALGAGRGRLVRQYLVESVVLALAGGALGLIVALWGVEFLVKAAPPDIPRLEEVGVDARVLGFMLAVALGAGIAVGIVPALHGSRVDLASTLKEGGRGTVGGRGNRLRRALVVAEVALSVILVAGAALLLRSFQHLRQVDLGFRPQRLLAVQVMLPPSRGSEPEFVTSFFRTLRDRVAALPGVESVALAHAHPLNPNWTSGFAIAGRDMPPPGQGPEANFRPVSPGYFRTAGIAFARGRDFTDHDVLRAPGVVIINEAFARRYFPGQDPIGQRLERGSAWFEGGAATFEIVGLVAGERFNGPTGEQLPAMYFPHAQYPFTEMELIIRTKVEPATLTTAVRGEVWRLDRTLPVDNVRTLEEVAAQTVAVPRFNTALLAGFAALALLLAAVGVYGVLSYLVAQRAGEIGVRMALGADAARVLRMVLAEGVLLAGVGVAMGLVAALWTTRLLGSLLFGVSPTDPVTFAAVTLTLAAVAAIASWLPARRATRVDPVVAMRGGQ
ncbi:MAG TPA: ABC transporter permease [Gemmatimonadaceae bacterium]|nr:ABC transporter permease [Gemmatimonadaceae bacterium]